MYLRAAHTDLHLPTLYKFIVNNPLGIFTTSLPSPNFHTIQSSHIPWVLDIPDSDSETTPPPKARLRGHLARANPQTKALIETATQTSSNTLQSEVMILFNGPSHHYITPKFYVETKPTTGKVVPTWNYSAVQVYGTATIHFDTSSPATGEFLTQQINDLSKQSEEKVFGFTGKDGKEKAWSVDDSPESYIKLLKKAIIGIEIEVESIAGKFKMSQELKEGDREGVVKGFEALGTDEGDEIARTVRERGEKVQ
ncbi:transcriptional regulator PAI 2-type [Leptodontidium sp. 2 PMI_412]|nr:putative transcriptional regulator [Leptodontidium sp. MPI-SDFR-AT-0119]KAH9220559.1 transcriptional regulator PAI 2-type [Leptodontidium sp. 2 PMI_412]